MAIVFFVLLPAGAAVGTSSSVDPSSTTGELEHHLEHDVEHHQHLEHHQHEHDDVGPVDHDDDRCPYLHDLHDSGGRNQCLASGTVASNASPQLALTGAGALVR